MQTDKSRPNCPLHFSCVQSIFVAFTLECIKDELHKTVWQNGCVTPHELTLYKNEKFVKYSRERKNDVCKDIDEYANKTYGMSLAAWNFAKGSYGYKICPGCYQNTCSFSLFSILLFTCHQAPKKFRNAFQSTCHYILHVSQIP